MNNEQYSRMTMRKIKGKISAGQLQKLDVNIMLLDTCTAETIDYEKAEELLKRGAEPLGYVEDVGGWPDNLYTEFLRRLFNWKDAREDYFTVTELFLRYGMDISKPAVPYDDDWILNPLCLFVGAKNDCMLRTIRLLLDHGLSAEDAGVGWGGQISDFINCCGSFSDAGVQAEFSDYIHMLMLTASYSHVLENDDALREEIWYEFNQGRCDLLRFRDWDWYDYEVDCSLCRSYPEVYRSVVTIVDRLTGEKLWTFGVSLSPEDVYGADRPIL